MKIAHIVCTYPPYYGGMGNVVFQMASELERRGHSVEVFTPLYGALPEEHLASARRMRPAFQLGNGAWMPTLHRELAAFDLVHLHYPFFGTANAVRRYKKKNPEKPLVVTYHMDTRAGGIKGFFFQWYAAFWMPRILSSADRVLTSSFDYARNSQAKQLLLLEKEKWIEMPFGVDTSRFIPGPRPLDLFAELGLDAKAETLLFVGGMDAAHAFKGIPIFLDALSLLSKNGAPVQAVLVGDGENRQRFERLAHFLGLGNVVRFVGRVEDDDLPAYYKLADVFVLPSTNQSEAFGMVILEAAASGVPVIATDIPGVRAIAEQFGTFVPPNDSRTLAEAIVEFFGQSSDEREQWRSHVRHIAETQYAWGPIVDQLEGVYTELVEKIENRK